MNELEPELKDIISLLNDMCKGNKTESGKIITKRDVLEYISDTFKPKEKINSLRNLLRDEIEVCYRKKGPETDVDMFVFVSEGEEIPEGYVSLKGKIIHFITIIGDLDLIKSVSDLQFNSGTKDCPEYQYISFYGLNSELEGVLFPGVISGNLEVVNYFVTSLCCGINKQNKHGYTPIHVAIKNNDLEMLTQLVKSSSYLENKYNSIIMELKKAKRALEKNEFNILERLCIFEMCYKNSNIKKLQEFCHKCSSYCKINSQECPPEEYKKDSAFQELFLIPIDDIKCSPEEYKKDSAQELFLNSSLPIDDIKKIFDDNYHIDITQRSKIKIGLSELSLNLIEFALLVCDNKDIIIYLLKTFTLPSIDNKKPFRTSDDGQRLSLMHSLLCLVDRHGYDIEVLDFDEDKVNSIFEELFKYNDELPNDLTIEQVNIYQKYQGETVLERLIYSPLSNLKLLKMFKNKDDFFKLKDNNLLHKFFEKNNSFDRKKYEIFCYLNKVVEVIDKVTLISLFFNKIFDLQEKSVRSNIQKVVRHYGIITYLIQIKYIEYGFDASEVQLLLLELSLELRKHYIKFSNLIKMIEEKKYSEYGFDASEVQPLLLELSF